MPAAGVLGAVERVLRLPGQARSVLPTAWIDCLVPENLPRVSGTVEWWSDEEGWGCLAADAAPGGAFVHFSEIVGAGYRTLRPGERVEFDLEDYPHGQDGYYFRAYKVEPLGR
jgi:cold shock protein